MISDTAELAELRKTTADLIEHDHESIVLVRSGWTRTPAGGQVRQPAANLNPQTLYFGAVRADARIVTTEDGSGVVASHVLIGNIDADIEKNDEFTIGDRNFKVQDIEPDRSWQVKAWVIEHAR